MTREPLRVNVEPTAKTIVWPEFIVRVCPEFTVIALSTPSVVPGKTQLPEIAIVEETDELEQVVTGIAELLDAEEALLPFAFVA